MDAEALRIAELVVEATVLLEWHEAGSAPDDVYATLAALRDSLCLLADHTSDGEACAAACGTVAAIDAALAAPLAHRHRGAA